MTNFVALGALVLCFAFGLRAQTAQAGKRAGVAGANTAPDIAKQRQQVLASIETEPEVAAADQRWVCATGGAPQVVRDTRTKGIDYVPDAGESCPLVVQRELHDGHGMELYERIARLGGDKMTAQEMLAAVKKAALNNDPQVPIGGGKAIPLTPALAADAGTLLGLTDTALTPESLHAANSPANLQKLRATEESCLDGTNPHPLPVSVCFTAGLVKAVMDRREVARK